jgi:hypothetical protein
VQVLPWVVEVCSVLDTMDIQQARTFLEPPESKQTKILRKSAAASVRALMYMHKVLKSGALRGRIREVAFK